MNGNLFCKSWSLELADAKAKAFWQDLVSVQELHLNQGKVKTWQSNLAMPFSWSRVTITKSPCNKETCKLQVATCKSSSRASRKQGTMKDVFLKGRVLIFATTATTNHKITYIPGGCRGSARVRSACGRSSSFPWWRVEGTNIFSFQLILVDSLKRRWKK